MRVIAGTAGSIRLEAPKSAARPSADRLREGLFNILAPRLAGARVLDLYAGSGALAIEALSRGAERAVLIDRDSRALRAIERNLERTRLAGKAEVRRAEVLASLPRLTEVFDLILADPPYGQRRDGLVEAAHLMQSADLPPLLAHGGLVVIESGCREAPATSSRWRWERLCSYGKSHLHFYSKHG